MTKGKLWFHQVVLFGVLGVLLLLNLIKGSFVFNVSLLWWLLGAVIGFLFVFGDRVVYSLVVNADDSLRVRFGEIFRKGNFVKELNLLLLEEYDQKELVARSFLFLVVWTTLAFFAMSSVVNSFARGLVLGIGIHLIFDMIYDYVKDKEKFDLWFWQIKRTLEPEEKRWFVIIMSLVFVLLAINL
jgi:hypothetical protein